MSFTDHFSAHAAAYAHARPTYPRALFARVHATDASAPQVANAVPHPRVAYAVAPAEGSGLPHASCDLVTVAQALHWFDLPRFWAEARRVLRPGGVFAAWSYARLHATGRVEAVVDALDARVGPWWPPERAMVDDAYASIALPFAPLAVEAPPMRARWTQGALLAYLRTWSAVRRHQADTGRGPVAASRRRSPRPGGAPGGAPSPGRSPCAPAAPADGRSSPPAPARPAPPPAAHRAR